MEAVGPKFSYIFRRLWDCVAKRAYTIKDLKTNQEATQNALEQLKIASKDVKTRVKLAAAMHLVPTVQVCSWLRRVKCIDKTVMDDPRKALAIAAGLVVAGGALMKMFGGSSGSPSRKKMKAPGTVRLIILGPAPMKNDRSRLDAIPVENYPRRSKKAINLSQDYSDDELQLLEPIPKRTRIYKGQSSNSKLAVNTKPSKVKTFMCEICVDEKPMCDLFYIIGCNHSYCSACIGTYVDSKLQENITAINCPVTHCCGFLEPQHCRFILPKQVFDRWGDALCEACILPSEKFYCPFKDCSALLVDERGGKNKVVEKSECPHCHRLFCAQCRVPWHLGIACKEFKKLNKDERSSEDIMLMNLAKKKKWMRCSKCRYYVSKSKGCLLMKCRCGYTFCYNCGARLKHHYCGNCKH